MHSTIRHSCLRHTDKVLRDTTPGQRLLPKYYRNIGKLLSDLIDAKIESQMYSSKDGLNHSACSMLI